MYFVLTRVFKVQASGCASVVMVLALKLKKTYIESLNYFLAFDCKIILLSTQYHIGVF